jgi:rhodanese-related sulfurtransferase
MGRITSILQSAQQRAKEKGLSYAGELYPTEAYEILQSAPGTKLVDVRSRAEVDWVGRIPDSIDIEWASYPGMKLNQYFMTQLEQQIEKEVLVLFICRSGVRSHHAAALATQAGYISCYNILEGFEGDKDDKQHRNSINGWRVAELPWEQA